MIIATHNGTFHADEVTACIIFSLLDESAQFIRSRDVDTLETADYIVDVSGKFDLIKHFDHHPSEFTDARNNGIKYATAGLIWKKFGLELLKKLALEYPDLANIQDAIFAKAWTTVDEKIMQYIDLSDNGQLDSYTAEICGITNNNKSPENDVYNKLKLFYQNIPVIPYIIAMQNISSNGDEYQFSQFIQTINSLKPLFKNIFLNTLRTKRDEEKVLNSYDGSNILFLSEKLPWLEAVKSNWDFFANCKIAIYPDHSKGYRIQSLPSSLSSHFINRCPAPVSWRGKEFEELNKLAGISSATFVHRSGFTGGAKTLEDIMTMAKNWIKESC
ncbi:MAG: MYG1 family protein [Succinivibrionaceae bacterium]